MRAVVWSLVAAAALAVVAPAHAQGPPYNGSGYLRYADRLQPLMDTFWHERADRYMAGRGGTESTVNANLLLTHAVAARAGHTGPARNDARARSLVRFFTTGPVWMPEYVEGRRRHGNSHFPGWSDSTGSSGQHMLTDTEILDALTQAYLGRAALGLDPADAELIRDRVERVSAGAYWAFPAMRMNQFNWWTLAYAARASVTGDARPLVVGLDHHLRTFARSERNLGPGLRFHYLPERGIKTRSNLDSAEYANLVISFSRNYMQARAAGMPLPAHRDLALMQAWASRVVAGYWTHSGYLNWDTGLGLDRWHQARKLGLAQLGLLGISAAHELQPGPGWGAWAKHLFDRSLWWYERRLVISGGRPEGIFFGVKGAPQGPWHGRLAAARIQANAMRALVAGLGTLAGEEPPPLYAYDPDTGRLAVTTPSYSTAVLPVTVDALPYGGLELARLYDGEGDVAATLGGRTPAAFGLRVRDARGRTLLATQSGGRADIDPRRSPLTLTRAPRGMGVRPQRAGGRAFASPFGDLRAVATRRKGRLRARVEHRFTDTAVTTRWRLTGRPRGARAEVLFPSHGPGARVTAVLADGREIALEGELRVRDVEYFRVRSALAAYRVRLLDVPRGATARTTSPRPQPGEPDPGPSLVIATGPPPVALEARLFVEARP